MSRRKGWQPHVLVATLERCPVCASTTAPCADCVEAGQMDYTVECPGPSGDCDAWDECPSCYVPGQGLDPERREQLENGDPEVHGVEHQWIDGRWMVRLDPAQCYVAGHDALPDAAEYVAAGVEGRYPVEHDVGDGTELELTWINPCPHAWSMGLPVGLLRECRYRKGHTGSHRNAAGDLSWSGKLTAEELALAERLRAAA